METVILGILVLTIAGLMAFYFFKTILQPKQLGRIQKLINSKQYSSAQKALKQLLAKKNNGAMNSKLHYLMAQTYEATGDLSMAVVEYRAALRGTEEESLQFEVSIRNKLGQILYNLKKKEEALSEYLMLVKIAPNNYEPYLQIGKIYYESNQTTKAAGYLQKAIKINQGASEAYFYLAMSKYKNNREEEALDPFLMALKYDPKNPEIHYYLGKIYKNMKDFMKALEEFEVAMREKKFRGQSLLERGLCFLEMGNQQNAVVEFERGLKEPSNENVMLATRYALAACYEDSRELMLAMEQWESISKVKSNYRDVPDKLVTYADLRHDDSLKDFLTAGDVQYEQTSKKLLYVMGMKVLDVSSERNGDLLVNAMVRGEGKKTMNTKLLGRLVRIRRETDKIHEGEVRQLLDKAKNENIARAVFITAGQFAPDAQRYGEARPIDLVDGNALQENLKQATEVSLSSLEDTEDALEESS